MEKPKNLRLSALAAVLVLLLVGGLVTAYMVDNASGKKLKERNGNMTGMPCGMGNRGGMPFGEFGNMTEMRGRLGGRPDLSNLDLPENATKEEIRTAMEAKMNETRVQIDVAIASGDYDAWKTLVEQDSRGDQLMAIVTEEKFPKYAELYQAQKKVRELSKELGLYGGYGGGSFGIGMMPMPVKDTTNA